MKSPYKSTQKLMEILLLLLQAPQEIQWTIHEAFSESGKALKELASAVEKMTKPSSPNPHIANLKIASENLKSLLKQDFWEEHNNILQVIPIAALLMDTVVSVEQIADAVNELSSLANFKCKHKSGVVGDSENENSKNFAHAGMIGIPSVSITIDGGDRVGVEPQSSVEADKHILMV